MKIPGTGLEIYECSDKYLCKVLGINRVMIILFGSISAVMAILCFLVICSSGQRMDGAGLIGLAGLLSLIFLIPCIYLSRQSKEIQKELNSRYAANSEYALALKEEAKNRTRSFGIILFGSMAIGAIIIIAIIADATKSTYPNKNQCKNCGRETSSSSGYCSGCYESYLDWQIDNW